jgi:hypothetical protein
MKILIKKCEILYEPCGIEYTIKRKGAEGMEKQTVYRFNYSGNHVRSVRATEEPRRDPGLVERNVHWFVVALGVLACVGWWRLWE